MFRRKHLAEIRRLDPIEDHQRIVYLMASWEHPFDYTRALEFALFRTFAVPSVADLLDRTGEFQSRPQKRYDDTDLLVSEIAIHGYDSERGGAAIRRMNQLHGRFHIANDDFLYVLSTFVYEPLRWIDRFGWRGLCEEERLGQFWFWRAVGERMGIKEIPDDYAAYERFNRDYEAAHFRRNGASERVGAATRDLFVGWFPRPLSPLVRRSIHALLDDPLLDAFGFPKPSRFLRALVGGALHARAVFLRCLPDRRSPRHRTEIPRRDYPGGYTIEQLGPPGTAGELPTVSHQH